MIRFTSFFGLATLLLVACTGNPPAGDKSYKQGSLNNGGFVFACSDGVACSSFSTGYAADFPTGGVALGSTFNIYFVPTDEQQGPAILTTPADASDITVRGLSPFFSGGPEGILAGDREGYGSLVAEHANNVVVDFINIRIVKPANLTIYQDSTSVLGISTAQDIGATLSIGLGASKKLRTVATDSLGVVLAGSIRSAWVSSDRNIFSAVVADGVATLEGNGTGDASLTLTGGGFMRTVAITVKP